MVDTYIEDQQIHPLTAEDRKLLSDLSSTFDLGTQTIIKLDEEDWMTTTLTEEQLKLRQQVLLILFKQFGNGKYSNQSIYECADEWISKGHVIASGVVKYYDAYYNK